MKSTHYILVCLLTSTLSAAPKKKSWARIARDFLRPCLSDQNLENWNWLIGKVEKTSGPVDQSSNEQQSAPANNPDTGTQDQRVCTFADIAGGVPPEIATLVNMIKHSEKYTSYGIVPPKGILLVGPPGCGKTLLARALAGESGCGFLYASATQFIEIYIGTGPKAVRTLFDQAAQYSHMNSNQKVIIFIDEIDALGSRAALAGHDSESRRTLNELLTQMDGFAQNSSIIVLAATNNPHDVDAALKRPGRFDTIVEIPLPDKERRRAIVQHYINKIPQDRVGSCNIDRIADATYGFNNADLKEMVRIACLQAAEEDANRIEQRHFDVAMNKIRAQKTF